MTSEGLVSDDAIATAKRLQNFAFKRFGVFAVLIGLVGFMPSIISVCTGVLLSVSHRGAPHTDVDIWLWVHAVAMIFWFLCVFAQLYTGGTPHKSAHRWVGWFGYCSVTVGMFTGLAWTIKYDFIVNDDPIAAWYTILLITMTWCNMTIAVFRAIQKKTMAHKDHALMAIMWSLDPAIHRLSMWIIQLCNQHVDPDELLQYGKLPANFLLVAIFGTMIVWGKRVSCITVTNIGMQLTLFYLGLLGVLTNIGDGPGKLGPVIWVPAFAGAVMLTTLVIVLVVGSRRSRSSECSEGIVVES